MVRLKELERRKIYFTSYISIPYGSIKRERGENSLEGFLFISIPYGSIKSLFKK